MVVLVLLERLQRIILYGNPLTGPTGEDPLGLSVEGLVDKADRYRVGPSRVPDPMAETNVLVANCSILARISCIFFLSSCVR